MIVKFRQVLVETVTCVSDRLSLLLLWGVSMLIAYVALAGVKRGSVSVSRDLLFCSFLLSTRLNRELVSLESCFLKHAIFCQYLPIFSCFHILIERKEEMV